ncbi:hypothetical protein ACFOY4_29510 [Actinomadura syzygii]|uniref:Uncharacterized protein n=2 Tax=Actinomadura syzygii TaxID=1427538 RepID=A0A5D0TTM3_9ACTN|nr:hypothetical protein FXF65_35450 [Actinomadura syzygii]
MRTKAMAVAVAAGMSLSTFAVAPSASAAPAAPAQQAGPRCDPHNVAKITAKKKFKKVNETDVLYNSTRDTITRKVHFERTTKLKYSVSGGIELSLNAFVFGEVKAKVNTGLDRESTVKKGYADTVKIRKGYKLTASQGWEMQQAKGYVYHIYSNCQDRTLGYFTLNAPWKTFVSYSTKKL